MKKTNLYLALTIILFFSTTSMAQVIGVSSKKSLNLKYSLKLLKEVEKIRAPYVKKVKQVLEGPLAVKYKRYKKYLDQANSLPEEKRFNAVLKVQAKFKDFLNKAVKLAKLNESLYRRDIRKLFTGRKIVWIDNLGFILDRNESSKTPQADPVLPSDINVNINSNFSDRIGEFETAVSGFASGFADRESGTLETNAWAVLLGTYDVKAGVIHEVDIPAGYKRAIVTTKLDLDRFSLNTIGILGLSYADAEVRMKISMHGANYCSQKEKLDGVFSGILYVSSVSFIETYEFVCEIELPATDTVMAIESSIYGFGGALAGGFSKLNMEAVAKSINVVFKAQ